MEAGLLKKIFGVEQQWQGPCTIIMNAEAAVLALGVDSIMGGGAKAYAPRMVSGRITADSVCLVQDASALLVLQQQKVRQSTGEESIRQLLTVADTAHIVAIEFPDTNSLVLLGVSAPLTRTGGSHPGTQNRPIIH